MSERDAVEGYVSHLVTLSRSDEVCRLLGVDGVLVDQVDITILDDPLDYLSYDIAAAVRDARESSSPVQATMLSTIVAEFRLCGALVPRIDHHDLVERVMRHLEDELA